LDDGYIWIGVSRTDSVMDLWTVNALRWGGLKGGGGGGVGYGGDYDVGGGGLMEE